MKTRVILLGNERKEGVPAAVERIREWIRDRAELVAVDLKGDLDLRAVDADLLIIFGGDGSILASARRMGDRPIPSIGVNFGKFGFLTDIRSREVETELDRVLTKNLVIEERLVLVGSVPQPDCDQEVLALNEFYLGPQTVGRMIAVELRLNGEYATTFRGDGLLVATPTGSTGHSLSAGGPIVDPELEAILLTPVSPHSLANRPLVVPPDVKVEIRALTDPHQTHATLSADGQITFLVPLGEVVTIRRAGHTFPIVRSGIRTRYDVLRSHLGWSGQPPYEAEER